jgi:Transketolase-like TK C-terminal domain
VFTTRHARTVLRHARQSREAAGSTELPPQTHNRAARRSEEEGLDEQHCHLRPRRTRDRHDPNLCIDAVGWERYVGANGAVVGMDMFGASAPLKELQGKFGFTPEAVVGIATARFAASAAG